MSCYSGHPVKTGTHPRSDLWLEATAVTAANYDASLILTSGLTNIISLCQGTAWLCDHIPV